MPFSINDIKSQLQFGGARPTQFQVRITNPGNPVADIKTPFMVTASEIPPAILGTIQIAYFGRRMKQAGDRQYPNWNVRVINDEDFLIRNALEEWSNKINSFEGNVRTFGTAAPSQYKSTAEVVQYGKTGNILRVYRFNGIFPVNIAPIRLSWEAMDEIEQYDVEFAFDNWEVVGGSTGNAGGV